jgi:hypothetical protein
MGFSSGASINHDFLLPTTRTGRERATLLNGTSGESVRFRLSGFRVCQALQRRRVAQIRRACPTISTRTFLASSGLLTSRKNAMRALRVPSGDLKRT